MQFLPAASLLSTEIKLQIPYALQLAWEKS